MKQLIIKLLEKWACSHKWESHFQSPVYNGKDRLPIRIDETLICEKCGKIKKIKL